MVELEVIEIIKKLNKLFSENNIHIKKEYLFGSYAKNEHNEWSDIDLAVISDDFGGNKFIDKNKIRRIYLQISNKFDIIPFNPTDFTKDNPFVKEIIETGIIII